MELCNWVHGLVEMESWSWVGRDHKAHPVLPPPWHGHLPLSQWDVGTANPTSPALEFASRGDGTLRECPDPKNVRAVVAQCAGIALSRNPCFGICLLGSQWRTESSPGTACPSPNIHSQTSIPRCLCLFPSIPDHCQASIYVHSHESLPIPMHPSASGFRIWDLGPRPGIGLLIILGEGPEM